VAEQDARASEEPDAHDPVGEKAARQRRDVVDVGGAGDRKDLLGMAVCEPVRLLDPTRGQLRVCIDAADELAFGLVETPVAGRSDALGGFVDQFHELKRPGDFGGAVGGIVVDHNNLIGRLGLLGDRFKRPLQGYLFVVGGYNNTELWLGHDLIIAKVTVGFGGTMSSKIMKNQLTPDAIDVNGKAVFYLQSGPRDAGRVMLILHGFMSDYRSLQIVAEDLAVGADTQLLLPDLPGFGSSEAMSDDEPDLDDYVNWVADFLKAVASSAQHVTLMGYSFGCYVAIKFAAERPEAVDELVLLTPVIKVATPVRIYGAGMGTLADLSVDAAQILYKWRPHFDLTNLYLARSRHPERVIRMLRHRRDDLSTLQPKVVMGLSHELLNSDLDLMDEAPKLKTARVFTILAKDDSLAVNSATQKFMQLVPAPKDSYILAKSGHMVPFEEPELVVRLLNQHFFKE
jgi:pimeloyl-ACP methyl ester carboxylesterase